MENCSKKGITLCSLIFCVMVFVLIVMMIAVGILYYYTSVIINSVEKIESTGVEVIEEETLSRHRAGEIAERYLDLKGATVYEVDEFIYMLGLIDTRTVEIEPESKLVIEDGYSLVKTNIKYDDYKNALLEVVSEKLFNESFSDFFREKDGYLYYPGNLGASGFADDFEDAKLIENTENEYKNKLWFTHTDVADTVTYQIYDATFVKENGRFVLDSIVEEK